MSKFTEILTVSPLPDGKTWIIKRQFGYDVDREYGSEKIVVPEGFETDFTSVPRFLWWLFPRWGKYGNAAVIHDFLYWDQSKYSRKESDKIFREAMKVLKVNFFVRTSLFLAVRIFGFMPWYKNKLKKRMGYKKIVNRKRVKTWKWKKDIK